LKKIRALIVDDEPLAREGLELLLAADPEVEVVGSAPDGGAAVRMMRALHPDLVLLDVQMPGLDGFHALAALEPAERPVVLFVTAFEKHAIRAFEVNAVDYLLKPYSTARFTAAMDRAKQTVRRNQSAGLSQKIDELLEHIRRMELGESRPAPVSAPSAAGDSADRIVLKAAGALHFVRAEEVIWIEAQGDFVKVQTLAKTQLVRETLQAIEQKLDPAKFLRIHRSFVVNLDHVRRVETALYGDYSVFMSDGTKLRLSRNYRAKLKTLLRPAAL
jgi:two-component system LytT family response regulator